jgi:hypothetical protein
MMPRALIPAFGFLLFYLAILYVANWWVCENFSIAYFIYAFKTFVVVLFPSL